MTYATPKIFHPEKSHPGISGRKKLPPELKKKKFSINLLLNVAAEIRVIGHGSLSHGIEILAKRGVWQRDFPGVSLDV